MMWRQVAIMSPYYAPHISPRHQEDALEAHSHSPRHLAPSLKPSFPQAIGFANQPHASVFQRGSADPFIDARGAAFTSWRQPSSDVSMPDYASSASLQASSRNVSDPMQISEKGDRTFQSMQMAGAYDQLCEALIPSAPANTPRAAPTPVIAPATRAVSHSSVKSETAPCKTFFTLHFCSFRLIISSNR